MHKYITGIIRRNNQKLIAINSQPDHMHLLIGMKPTMRLSDLIRDIKANSSSFIKRKGKCFSWQEGYSAFSYGQSQLGRIINYIQNQEANHAKRSFREEYLEILNRYKVTCNTKYIFNDVE